MSTIEQTKQAIHAATAGSGFRCVNVSWEDAQRTNFGTTVSSVGPNISDVRLYEKSGSLLYTLRSDNWNERLGYVSAGDIALVTGNEKRVPTPVMEPTTLRSYLQSIGTYGSYAGIQTPSLYDPSLDEIFSIRFQAVFLPIKTNENVFGAPKPSTTEFCTEVFSYNTRTDSDPRNLLLLATPQGTSLQQDGVRGQRQYFHSVDGMGAVHRFWLEASKSEKAVGGSQWESAAEAAEAAARGKATAVNIGTNAMGTRFNVQMLIQVPLKQAEPKPFPSGGGWGGGALFGSTGFPNASTSGPFGATSYGGVGGGCNAFGGGGFGAAPQAAGSGFGSSGCFAQPSVGVSNAARVSRGTKQDTFAGVVNTRPQRDPSQHGTITVTLYYTVAGGVPSHDDIRRATVDLDALFKSCPSDKALVNCKEVTHNASMWPTHQGVVPPVPAPKHVPNPTPGGWTPPAPKTILPATRCPAGHALIEANTNAAPSTLFCDCCGMHIKSSTPGFNAKSCFGCRVCDFDLCTRCSKVSCPQGMPLLPVPIQTLGSPAQCFICHQQYDSRIANMRGCACGINHHTCSGCYAVKYAAAQK